METNANFTHVHVLAFGDLEEAAAFVAALSRYLSSPAGLAFRSGSSPAEVWARVLTDDAGVEVYLSDAALAATAAGFAPPVTSGAQLKADVAANATRVIDSATRALGRDEVLQRLTDLTARRR